MCDYECNTLVNIFIALGCCGKVYFEVIVTLHLNIS